MKCLRSLVGVSQIDRVINEEVRRRAGIESKLVSRADQRGLRWFGHVERMDEYRMARRMVMAEVCVGTGRRETEVSLEGWCEGGLRQHRSDGGGCAKYQKEWKALVHMY